MLSGGHMGAGRDAKLKQSDSMPGPLKMDEGARIVTADEQRLTGHSGAVLCMALQDNCRLFSSSADLSIKVEILASSCLWLLCPISVPAVFVLPCAPPFRAALYPICNRISVRISLVGVPWPLLATETPAATNPQGSCQATVWP